MKNSAQAKKGFILIEVMVTLAVFTILASVSSFDISASIEKENYIYDEEILLNVACRVAGYAGELGGFEVIFKDLPYSHTNTHDIQVSDLSLEIRKGMSRYSHARASNRSHDGVEARLKRYRSDDHSRQTIIVYFPGPYRALVYDKANYIPIDCLIYQGKPLYRIMYSDFGSRPW